MTISTYIQSQTNLPAKGIASTIKLLEDGATIPFIARYRKEMTGNLDEVALRDILKFKEEYEKIEARKEFILSSIEEQGALSPELQSKIQGTFDLSVLEDLYLPYKKKRKTKAEVARKKGLEPLAKIIMSQRTDDPEYSAQKFVKGEVTSTDDAIEGAQHIIAEWVSERTDIRSGLRRQFENYASVTSKVVAKKKDEPEAKKYKDYFDWDESLKRCPSHRLLALLRAEHEGYIRLKIGVDDEIALDKIKNKIIRSNGACADIIEDAIKDSYKRLLQPSLANERLKIAKEQADKEAIEVFGKNLQQLLLGAPLGEQRILAIDPGFRTGCKVVCLDAQGDLLANTTIYPHAPKYDVNGASSKIMNLCSKYDIEAIAIGNGTASRETEHFVKDLKLDKEIFVVSEAGASIYSASDIARDEFPDHDVTVRGAVSIGRRLADPLAELVKIDPKSIGVGQYQHDVDQGQLKASLDTVVEHCVNKIGVNVNTASVPLLSYVSGIGQKLAEKIVTHRNENGAYASRNDLKKVPRLGNKVFEQAAGFLRIKQADNPLDDSAVHPESYHIVKKMLKTEKLTLDELIGNKKVLQSIDLKQYVSDGVGLPTLKDIVKELEKPGVDIREKAKAFSFDESLRTIDDVHSGQVVPGIVNNITKFGCFVNIGIKESGLIHISNMSNTFVKDVNDHVSLHQHVMVKVLEVDRDRKRIQLSLQ